MANTPEKPYQETVSCEARPDEGVIFVKVVAMPYAAAVEFDVAQARAFANEILSAVGIVEAGWVGKSGGAPNAGGA